MEKGYSHPHLVTTPAELEPKIGRPGLALIDTRSAEEFAEGHLPGAIHFDLFGISLTDTSPAPLKAFMSMMRHLCELRGVDENKEVVFYEENSGMRAARGFWFLEYFGHPNVRVLDGGVGAWKKAGLPMTQRASKPKSSTFRVAEQRELLATAEDVLLSLGSEGHHLLDTRSAAEYFGRQVRAARGGAIPGAVHIEWTQNLSADGSFKSASVLETMYKEAGIGPDREIIAYCQGGYRAAQSYLALRLIGYPRIRNYIGSWREWGDRLDLPIERPRPKS
jgi:thiosulfate/3-mercaptopyruvate sulfurtransferase